MTKTVDAILRGPKPHFRKGVLYAPGQIVPGVPAHEVSDEDFREEEVEVEAKNGEMVKRKVQRPVKFRPLDSQPTVASPVTTADIATGSPDRLNVTDFLKQSTDDIEKAITSGSVDDHLGAIEQAEIARKGPARAAVKEAISARLAAIAR